MSVNVVVDCFADNAQSILIGNKARRFDLGRISAIVRLFEYVTFVLPHYFVICAGDGNYLLYLKKHSIRIVMPYISIECGTLTAVQKQKLIEQLTEAAAGATGIPKQFFMVSIKELPGDSIGIGGRSIDRIKKEYENDEAAG